MEIVKAQPIDNNEEESKYNITIDLIEVSKLLITIFNTEKGITYKKYIEKDSEWFKSNIYAFGGIIGKLQNILNKSLVIGDDTLPYKLEEGNEELFLNINHLHELLPFELSLQIPRVFSDCKLEDRIISLEYQIHRLKSKLNDMKVSENENSNKDEIYNAMGILIYKGEMKDGKPHGIGIQYCQDSELILYKGEFKDGYRDGQGTLYWYYGGNFSGGCNGDLNTDVKNEFVGGFKRGLFHGEINRKHNTGSKLALYEGGIRKHSHRPRTAAAVAAPSLPRREPDLWSGY